MASVAANRLARSTRAPLQWTIVTAAFVAGCHGPRATPINAGGAPALLAAARDLDALEVLDRETGNRRYTMNSDERDRFRCMLARSVPTESLATVAPSWQIVLRLQLGDRGTFVLHPIDSVLRLNCEAPFSAAVVDAAGNFNPPTIRDLLLEYDDWDWLHNVLEQQLGPPTSNEVIVSPVY